MNSVPVIIYVIINSSNKLQLFLSSEINAGLERKNKPSVDIDLYNSSHERNYIKRSPESRILYEALNPSNKLQLSADLALVNTHP